MGDNPKLVLKFVRLRPDAAEMLDELVPRGQQSTRLREVIEDWISAESESGAFQRVLDGLGARIARIQAMVVGRRQRAQEEAATMESKLEARVRTLRRNLRPGEQPRWSEWVLAIREDLGVRVSVEQLRAMVKA